MKRPRRHDTPGQVASTLARWAPAAINSLLEPAVGVGCLLTPIASRISASGKIVCVDKDPAAIAMLRSQSRSLPYRSKLRVIAGDFLTPKVRVRVESHAPDGFDCIVMNPPFLSRGSQRFGRQEPGALSARNSLLPIEARFLATAVELLRRGGRLLAIVPASVVAGDDCADLRRALMLTGAIRFVHELPPYTFPTIEARVYLLAFDKAVRRRHVVLLNHRLRKPDRLAIPTPSTAATINRLDFGYHDANRSLTVLLQNSAQLGWEPLGSQFTVRRGTQKSSKRDNSVLHTHHSLGGIWHIPSRTFRRRRVGKAASLLPTDIVIARVHRNAVDTAGILSPFTVSSWSDCVFRLRPHVPNKQIELLLLLRVMFGIPGIAETLVRGSGAKYITSTSLIQFPIPTNLPGFLPGLVRRYKGAVGARDLTSMHCIEADARHVLVSEFQAARRLDTPPFSAIQAHNP